MKVDGRSTFNMREDCNCWEWCMNVLKKMEEQCVKLCETLEKEVLKYIDDQKDPVGEANNQSSVEGHHSSSSVDAFVQVPEHHVQMEEIQTIQSSDKYNQPILKPNYSSVYKEISGAHKIENENTRANIPRSLWRQSQKAKTLTLQKDEFLDWEIV